MPPTLTLVALLLLVPLADQVVKGWLRCRLANQSLALGPLGSLRVVESRIWLARLDPKTKTLWLSIGWAVGAAWLSAESFYWLPPQHAWSTGLLLGGSLSHLLETAARGCVTDYVCLRFWPAFNLADVAILTGALGLVIACWELICTITL